MDKYIKEMFNDVRKFCSDLKAALVAATEDTGWIRLNANVVYRRKNGVVYVNGMGEGNATLIAGTYVTVGTLPVGFRPSRDVVGLGIDGYGASGMDFTGSITSTGEIKLYSVSNTNYWRLGASFPIGGGHYIKRKGGALHEFAHHLNKYIKCIKKITEQKKSVLLQKCDCSESVRADNKHVRYQSPKHWHISSYWGRGSEHILDKCEHCKHHSAHKLYKSSILLWARFYGRRWWSASLGTCGGDKSKRCRIACNIWLSKLNIRLIRAFARNKTARITPRGGICYA